MADQAFSGARCSARMFKWANKDVNNYVNGTFDSNVGEYIYAALIGLSDMYPELKKTLGIEEVS